MRNYSFVGSNLFAIHPDWSKETHAIVRSTVVNALFTLFQTGPEDRQLSRCSVSERRVLVSFRHWFLAVKHHRTTRPFVYVNVNTGKSLVLTVASGKGLLVDPRFLAWEGLFINPASSVKSGLPSV